eukprot:TRINITY_DN340_c0_g2_i2.p1 TRINITY_DN340_c0_g2~~TRINITY_DN340_c0_g2_i2.p1  ORF type:complete len:346 (+),score=34.91 TRINITY_DN340_c0_g2_i2:2-1039(+)
MYKNNDNIKATLLGQFLSLLIASTAVCSTFLVNKGVNIPTTQSFFNYLLLAFTMGLSRLHSRKPLPRRWPLFIFVSFLDVEANFLLVKAYQYTSITSVTLLDCFSLPCVMILSFIILQARYRVGHVVGGFLCVFGLSFLIVMDHHGEAAGDKPLLGDVLVLIGALLYSVCNVTQERLLKDSTVQDFLLLMGVFGVAWSGVQVAIFERSGLVSAFTGKFEIIILLLGFSISLYLFYCLVPFVLKWSGSTVLNLSLLSSDLWGALARMLFFGGFSGASAGAFFGSLSLVTIGLVIYAKSGNIYQKGKIVQYQQVDEQLDDYNGDIDIEVVSQQIHMQQCEMQNNRVQ